jgi:hypothetical protein
MKRKKAEELSVVLQRFLRESGLESPLNQHRLVEMWPEVVGELVSKATDQIFIQNQTLVIHLTSPILKNEIAMRSTALVHELNRRVGTNVIVDIKLI